MKSMKRKEVEEVSDDFSHFSLSAPASKIRRLDAEMLGITVMDDAEMLGTAIVDDAEMLGTAVVDDAEVEVDSPASPSSSPEMPIVVYKPLFDLSNNSNLASSFSVSLHPHHLSALSHLTRNQFLPSGSNHPDFKSAHDQADAEAETGIEAETSRMQRDGENCMAVVPWVGGFEPQEMEVEQEEQEQQPNIITHTTHPLSHYHQFHCMPQHLPTTNVATAPVTWFH